MHTRSAHTAAEVLVVGAGPAGLTAAITLARHGIDVLVVERHLGTSPFPKATGVSTRTMELFRSWGVEQAIRAGAMAVEPRLAVSDTLAGPRHALASFGFPTDEEARAVSPTTPACCPQDHLEPVLTGHLRRLGGRIRFGTELTAVDAGDLGVGAEVRPRDGGPPETIAARYLVAADGPRSPVRSASGVGIDTLGTLGSFVSVTFRAPLTGRLPHPPAAVNAVETEGAPGLFIPTGADDRWIYAVQTDPAAPDGAAWPPSRWTALLRTATGMPDLRPDLLGVQSFEMAGQVARAFRAGRVFLVGDAAHRMTPVGGTGMNTAIHAAHNLGWKLAFVLRGWAAPALLDTYETERRPVGTRNMLRSLQPGPAPGDNGLARDLFTGYGPAWSPEVLPDTAAEGQRAPHSPVAGHGRAMSTLDLFDGRLVVLTDRGAEWRGATRALAATGLPITCVALDRDVQDLDRETCRRYGLRDGGAVLVRPDGYVARRLAATARPLEALAAAAAAALGSPADGFLRAA